MVRGVTAYRSIQQTLPKSSILGQSKKAVTKAATEVKQESATDLSKLVILPGAIAGSYVIANLNQIKCGGGCDDFDCDFNVYTFG